MIKVELHCHSLGGSVCGHATMDDIIDDYTAKGFGGVVLTNHYSSYNPVETSDEITLKDKVDKFFALYDDLKEKGAKRGLKVFFGAEIRIIPTNTEYMLYGFDREFLYKNPTLYELTQKELFALAEKNGIFMYQTHPFREGVDAGNPKYMHGAESFNGHFHHVNNNALAKKFCEENSLIEMVGCDYHDKDQPISSYALIPEYINDEKSLADYLMKGKAEFVTDEQDYINNLKKYKASKGIII